MTKYKIIIEQGNYTEVLKLSMDIDSDVIDTIIENIFYNLQQAYATRTEEAKD